MKNEKYSGQEHVGQRTNYTKKYTRKATSVCGIVRKPGMNSFRDYGT